MSSTACADARGDGHGVGAELLDDARADDFALQAMRDAAPDGGRLADVRDVAEQHRDVTAHRDHRAAQIVNGLGAAERAHGPLDRSLRR